MDNPTNYLLSVGFPLELIEKTITQSSITVLELAQAIKTMLDNGNTIEEILNGYYKKYPDLFSETSPNHEIGRNGSEFKKLDLQFLWKPFLQIGEYTVVFGNSGTGKTFYTALNCAAVTTGKYPTGEKQEPKPVLYVSGEETFDEVIDRIIRCGGNQNYYTVIDCSDSVGLNIDEGFDDFLSIVRYYKPKLLVLDPWQCFLGRNVDMNRQNVLRPILQKLTLLAKKVDCSIIVVSHVNKKDQGSDANNAASGSSELINACRSAIRLVEDEKDDDRRIAGHTKSNHAKRGDSLCFRFTLDGLIRWDGKSMLTKSDLEKAARTRKSPGEVIEEKTLSEEQQQKLISALLEEARNTQDCGKRLTYEELKLQYGQSIFCGEQPKRILDTIEPALKARNILIKTGIQIRRNGKTYNGFFLQQISE